MRSFIMTKYAEKGESEPLTTSRKSSAFRIELLRIMLKPTKTRFECKVKVGEGFKEVYEFARKGFSIFKGGNDGTGKK